VECAEGANQQTARGVEEFTESATSLYIGLGAGVALGRAMGFHECSKEV
jgi:hypothetical protein